jgi:fatty acid desaturase
VGLNDRGADVAVERTPLPGLFFLFNNLHSAHHENPGLPWYVLHRYYRAKCSRLLAENGGLFYRGYLEIALRLLLTPHDTPTHPAGRRLPTRIPDAFSVDTSPDRIRLTR